MPVRIECPLAKGCQIFDRYNFLVMRILEISVKDGVKGNTLTVLYPALIQIVSWIVVEPLLIVFKVTIIYIFTLKILFKFRQAKLLAVAWSV